MADLSKELEKVKHSQHFIFLSFSFCFFFLLSLKIHFKLLGPGNSFPSPRSVFHLQAECICGRGRPPPSRVPLPSPGRRGNLLHSPAPAVEQQQQKRRQRRLPGGDAVAEHSAGVRGSGRGGRNGRGRRGGAGQAEEGHEETQGLPKNERAGKKVLLFHFIFIATAHFVRI